MNIPVTVIRAALRSRLNVGRDHTGAYYVRCPRTMKIIETTRSAKPTVANALAMIRRASRLAPNPEVLP
jgi:hypothetical protein